MIALRWIMGLLLVATSGGFFALTQFSRGFRRSMGASPLNPLIQVLPLIAAAILLGGLVAPTNRALMHAGAVAAVGLIGFCVWQAFAEKAFVVWLGVAYLLIWLWYYWRSVHGTPA